MRGSSVKDDFLQRTCCTELEVSWQVFGVTVEKSTSSCVTFKEPPRRFYGETTAPQGLKPGLVLLELRTG